MKDMTESVIRMDVTSTLGGLETTHSMVLEVNLPLTLPSPSQLSLSLSPLMGLTTGTFLKLEESMSNVRLHLEILMIMLRRVVLNPWASPWKGAWY